MSYRLCKECGQPMLPKGREKKPNEFDHARGCPLDPKTQDRFLSQLVSKATQRGLPAKEQA
jgi:hypothetical protein